MDSLQLPIGIDTSRLRANDAVRFRVDEVARLRTGDAMRLRAGDAPADDAAAASATAKKFESVFSTLLVKEMRRSLSDGFFGEGAAGDIYSGWLDDHVGDALAERDALHMREMIERSVLHRPEVIQ